MQPRAAEFRCLGPLSAQISRRDDQLAHQQPTGPAPVRTQPQQGGPWPQHSYAYQTYVASESVRDRFVLAPGAAPAAWPAIGLAAAAAVLLVNESFAPASEALQGHHAGRATWLSEIGRGLAQRRRLAQAGCRRTCPRTTCAARPRLRAQYLQLRPGVRRHRLHPPPPCSQQVAVAGEGHAVHCGQLQAERFAGLLIGSDSQRSTEAGPLHALRIPLLRTWRSAGKALR